MIVGRAHTARHGRLVGTDDGAAFVRGGRGPCVVAFHGFTGTTAELRPLLDRLAASGFAVRAPLLTGHGSHPAALQDVTFEAIVADMLAELERAVAEHGEVVVVGFSLGSLVAIELAARRPAGLRGLVLLGNALTLAPVLARPLGFVARRGWTFPDWYVLKLAPDLRDAAMRSRILAYDRDPLRAAQQVYRAGVLARARLGEVTCPTLVLHGAKDRVCPPSNVELARRGLGARDVRTRIFDRSAHLLAADHDREEVAAAVTAFVEELALASQRPVDP
ncbi:MAG: esterase [Labilithrix sp.]|nr:esterase [Labilithrix sp.]